MEFGIPEAVAVVAVVLAGIAMTFGAIVLERRADAEEEGPEDAG